MRITKFLQFYPVKKVCNIFSLKVNITHGSTVKSLSFTVLLNISQQRRWTEERYSDRLVSITDASIYEKRDASASCNIC